MTKELKPCPACGNETPSEKLSQLQNGMWMSKIECLDDFPATSFKSIGVGETPEQAHELAVDNWNTRHKRTCKNIAQWHDGDFKCSKCTAELEYAPTMPWGKHETDETVRVNYCPCCGAEVLDG